MRYDLYYTSLWLEVRNLAATARVVPTLERAPRVANELQRREA